MKVAVYCSAKDVIPEQYLQLGDKLGAWLATHGHELVYGGATGGLMSRVSNAFKQQQQLLNATKQQKIYGVIPKKIIQAGRLATNCDNLCQVNNMNERKQKMKELADCFICLPGSYGTLDEMFDVIAGGTVGEHQKPIFILNYNGFYEPLKQQIALMKELHFIPENENYKASFVNTLDELLVQINKGII